MDSLKDKIALVTGASRGIGRACAVALGQEGAVIAVNYRERENEAAESCRLIEAAGGRFRSGRMCRRPPRSPA